MNWTRSKTEINKNWIKTETGLDLNWHQNSSALENSVQIIRSGLTLWKKCKFTNWSEIYKAVFVLRFKLWIHNDCIGWLRLYCICILYSVYNIYMFGQRKNPFIHSFTLQGFNHAKPGHFNSYGPLDIIIKKDFSPNCMIVFAFNTIKFNTI